MQAPAFDQDDDYRKKVFNNLQQPLPPGVTKTQQSQVENPNNVGTGTGIAPPTFASAPAGGGYDLEKTRQAWAAPGIGGRVGMGDLQKFLGDNANGFTQGVTLRGEKLYDPSGKFMFDAIGNYKSGDPNQMTRIALDGIGSNGQARSSRPATSRNPSVQTPATTTAAAAPAANTFLTQIRQQIMDRLGKMSGDPSMDDPALKAQSETYRVSRSRGADEARAAMAERAAANGTLQGGQSSGAFDTELRSIHEAKGEDIAGNDARLLGGEVAARRNEVQSLMNMALQSGDAESARMLQMQLAKMDEALRKQQMAQQNSQYYAGLNQQGSQFDRSLADSRYRYDDTMGFNAARSGEDDYRFRVLQGLG